MQRPNIMVICISLTLLCSVFSCTKDPVDYSKDINDLKALVTELQHRSDSLATALGNTNTNLSNLSKSVDSIKLKLTDIQTQIDALTLSLTTTNANIAAINAQLILLNQQYASLLAQLNAILAILNGPPTTLLDGLVAYYPFTGNAGDSSGNGNHGTVNGAMLTADRFGNSNMAYTFNGTTDYIDIAATGAATGNNGVSLSGWFYESVNSSHVSYIVSYGNPAFLGSSFGMGEYGTGGIFSTFSGSQYDAISNILCPIKSWHNLTSVHTKDGAISLYLDGKIIFSKTVTSPNILISDAKIGRPVWSGTSEFWEGKLDDIRIYNRALAQSEITYLASH